MLFLIIILCIFGVFCIIDEYIFMKQIKKWFEEEYKLLNKDYNDNSNKCVCCGVEIPEGRQVCPKCERIVDDFNQIPN